MSHISEQPVAVLPPDAQPSRESRSLPSPSAAQQQGEAHVAVAMQADDAPVSNLPMGAGAALDPSAPSSSVQPFPSLPVARAQALAPRTPAPPLPEYQEWGKKKAVGVKGKTVWLGLKIFHAAEFVGEVFADFFGLYDSKYQYVVDAYEREKRTLEIEREERLRLKREEKEERKRRREEQQQHSASGNVQVEQSQASSSSTLAEPSTTQSSDVSSSQLPDSDATDLAV